MFFYSVLSDTKKESHFKTGSYVLQFLSFIFLSIVVVVVAVVFHLNKAYKYWMGFMFWKIKKKVKHNELKEGIRQTRHFMCAKNVYCHVLI